MELHPAYRYRVEFLAPGLDQGRTVVSVWPAVYLARPDLYRVTRVSDNVPISTIDELLADSLTTYEFTEEVCVLGTSFVRVYRLQYSRRPPFSDAWYTPYGGGRARTLSITIVR